MIQHVGQVKAPRAGVKRDDTGRRGGGRRVRPAALSDAPDGVCERLAAGLDTGVGGVFVEFQCEARLARHFLPEILHDEGVRAAVEIGDVEREQVRSPGDEPRAGKNILA